jgi:hypothetical protein
LFSPTTQTKTVISTEAAHAFVSSAAEKSTSLPNPDPAKNAVAFYSLFPTPYSLPLSHSTKHPSPAQP